MSTITDIIFTGYSGGIFFMLIGIFYIRRVLKHPELSTLGLRPDMNAWFAGIAGIIIGILMIIGEIAGIM